MRRRLLPLCSFLLFALLAGCARQAPNRVAVLNFENATGDPRLDFLRTAIPEYLVSRLSNEQVRMLERQAPSLRGRPEAEVPFENREWLARNLNRAHYFVVGSISRLERNFVLTARICHAMDGELIPGTAVTQTCIYEYDIYNRVQTMAAFLAAHLRRYGVETPLALNPSPPLETTPGDAEKGQ